MAHGQFCETGAGISMLWSHLRRSTTADSTTTPALKQNCRAATGVGSTDATFALWALGSLFQLLLLLLILVPFSRIAVL